MNIFQFLQILDNQVEYNNQQSDECGCTLEYEIITDDTISIVDSYADYEDCHSIEMSVTFFGETCIMTGHTKGHSHDGEDWDEDVQFQGTVVEFLDHYFPSNNA